MSPAFKIFAVAGAGPVGSLIVQKLLDLGASVVVLTRGSNAKIPTGASQKVVDYTAVDSVAATLAEAGVEVVISALDGPGIAAQIPLADAAKRAGVKLFVPSELGLQRHAVPSPSPLDGKKETIRHLEQIGLPYTAYYTGLWADLPLSLFPWVLDLEARTFTVVGTADVTGTFTALPDIAHFVGYTLTHLEPSQLENKILAVEGSRLTFREVLQVYEKRYGGTFQLKVRDAEQVRKELLERGYKSSQGFVDWVLWAVSQGYGDMREYNAMHLVPDWTPADYSSVVARSYP